MTPKTGLHDDDKKVIVEALIRIIDNAKGILEDFGYRVNVVIDPLGPVPEEPK